MKKEELLYIISYYCYNNGIKNLLIKNSEFKVIKDDDTLRFFNILSRRDTVFMIDKHLQNLFDLIYSEPITDKSKEELDNILLFRQQIIELI